MPASFLPPYTKELTPPASSISPSSPADHIRWLQEWLIVRGYDIGIDKSKPRNTPEAAGIDGDFGKLTETACRNFAHDHDFSYTSVDAAFLDQLLLGLRTATSYKTDARTFGAGIVDTARRWLFERPHEARVYRDGILYGEDNSGAFVRHVMRGMHGSPAPWCQGMVDEMIEQVARALNTAPPLDTILDGVRCLFVPRMVDEAKSKGIFCGGSAVTPSAITPGSIFFLKGGQYGYSHTGIVESVVGQSVTTLEGNTNDDGSANGWEFIRRSRPILSSDYALIP